MPPNVVKIMRLVLQLAGKLNTNRLPSLDGVAEGLSCAVWDSHNLRDDIEVHTHNERHSGAAKGRRAKLWIEHRNYDPAEEVSIRINEGAWQPVGSSPIDLGIPTYGYDTFQFLAGIGRGTLTVDESWANDRGRILLDDDDPWSFPGTDIYTFTVVLSWSGLTAVEPYLPAPAPPPVADFAVVRFRWTPESGDDLDIGVSLLLPPETSGDGSSHIGYGWGDFYGPEERPYLRWGGDSAASGEPEEACAVDLVAIRESAPGTASIRLEARADWYTGSGPIQLTLELYSGGSLEQVGGHFENPSGTLVESVNQVLSPGGVVGYFDINFATFEVAFSPT